VISTTIAQQATRQWRHEPGVNLLSHHHHHSKPSAQAVAGSSKLRIHRTLLPNQPTFSRYDRAEVAAAVAGQVPGVLAHFGIENRKFGDEYKTAHCPDCGPRSRRDAVAINAITGQWQCHAHGCHSSIVDLVALYAGLQRSDFAKALQLTAEIIGIAPSSTNESERQARRSQAQQRLLEQQRRQTDEDAQRDAQARTTAPTVWQSLQWRNAEGEAYLHKRGLGELVARGIGERADLVDTVNVHNRGDGPVLSDVILKFAPVRVMSETARMLDVPAICVPARCFVNGSIVNVVSRAIQPIKDRKVFGLPKLPKQGAFGAWLPNWGRLGSEPHDINRVILVEGLVDYLTARLAWPRALVIGADGSNMLPKVAAQIAPTIAKTGTRLLIVPHRDGETPSVNAAGQRAAIEAIKAAIAGGLRMNITVGFLHLRANDLNDAWCAGWRPADEQHA
jgi:hypothetical protein